MQASLIVRGSTHCRDTVERYIVLDQSLIFCKGKIDTNIQKNITLQLSSGDNQTQIRFLLFTLNRTIINDAEAVRLIRRPYQMPYIPILNLNANR